MKELNIELIIALIPVVAILLRYILPILTQKIDAEKLRQASKWVGIAVGAAEQIYNERYQGEIKKDYVLKFLNQKGIKLTEAELNALIEATVKEFNTSNKPLF